MSVGTLDGLYIRWMDTDEHAFSDISNPAREPPRPKQTYTDMNHVDCWKLEMPVSNDIHNNQALALWLPLCWLISFPDNFRSIACGSNGAPNVICTSSIDMLWLIYYYTIVWLLSLICIRLPRRIMKTGTTNHTKSNSYTILVAYSVLCILNTIYNRAHCTLDGRMDGWMGVLVLPDTANFSLYIFPLYRNHRDFAGTTIELIKFENIPKVWHHFRGDFILLQMSLKFPIGRLIEHRRTVRSIYDYACETGLCLHMRHIYLLVQNG